MKKKYTATIVLICIYSSILSSDPTEPHFMIRNFIAYNSEQTIAYLFAHGLGATQQQAITLFAHVREKDLYNDSYIYNPFWIIDDPIVLFDFPDAKDRENEYRQQYVNLGQKQDMQRFDLAYHKAMNELPHHNFVFVGVSRGAATTINYVGLYKPQKVRALVIESSFDSITTVVKHLLKRFYIDWLPFSTEIGLKIAQAQFANFDTEGIFPSATILKLPPSLPIIFVHSQKDRVIPIKSSRTLYVALKALGYQHVYLLELEAGLHGKLMLGSEASTYQNVVHAFYKKYHLPYNHEFARLGDPLLALCQPSIAEIMYRLKNKKSISTT